MWVCSTLAIILAVPQFIHLRVAKYIKYDKVHGQEVNKTKFWYFISHAIFTAAPLPLRLLNLKAIGPFKLFESASLNVEEWMEPK